MINDIPIIPGEITIREYDCLIMDNKPKMSKVAKKMTDPSVIRPQRRTYATLTVTNKRVLYISQRDRLTQRGTSHFHQTSIGDVGDISMIDARWHSFKLILILLLVTLFAFMILGSAAIVVLLVAGFIGIMSFLHPNTLIYISISSKANSSGIYAGKVGSNCVGDIHFTTKPGADFDLMSRELGTLIMDLQQNGDSCLPRWLSRKDCPSVLETFDEMA